MPPLKIPEALNLRFYPFGTGRSGPKLVLVSSNLLSCKLREKVGLVGRARRNTIHDKIDKR